MNVSPNINIGPLGAGTSTAIKAGIHVSTFSYKYVFGVNLKSVVFIT